MEYLSNFEMMIKMPNSSLKVIENIEEKNLTFDLQEMGDLKSLGLNNNYGTKEQGLSALDLL